MSMQLSTFQTSPGGKQGRKSLTNIFSILTKMDWLYF